MGRVQDAVEHFVADAVREIHDAFDTTAFLGKSIVKVIVGQCL